jgi:hypothetical protein
VVSRGYNIDILDGRELKNKFLNLTIAVDLIFMPVSMRIGQYL